MRQSSYTPGQIADCCRLGDSEDRVAVQVASEGPENGTDLKSRSKATGRHATGRQHWRDSSLGKILRIGSRCKAVPTEVDTGKTRAGESCGVEG